MNQIAKQHRRSIQLWLNNVETSNAFELKDIPAIVRALKLQLRKRKESLGDRLKYAEAEEGWPVRPITIEKEDMLLHKGHSYQRYGISFEHVFAFTTSWNIIMVTLMRHDNVERVCYEDIMMSHDDGPYRNFSKLELRNIFGYVPIEPAMDNQIKAFGSKKASEKNDVVGGHRHKQVDRCYVFSWWCLILHRMHGCDVSNFNFYVDHNGDYHCDAKLKFLTVSVIHVN